MPIADVEKIVRKEPLEDFYEVGKELGRGKFAIVKRCTEKATGLQYASKILKKRRRGKSVREDILMEIDIMRQGMGHNRIIKLYEVFESQNDFHIIIELAMGGELFRLIAVDPLREHEARDVVYQILDGVQHLHTLNIVHMDLKPENLLLYRKGSLDIKIVDFGLAVQLQEGQEMKTLVGTAEYVSPEILSFEPLSTYSDMWSIGALTYALLAGYSPFQGETHQETFLNVSTCDYDFEDEVFDAVSADAKDFIEKLLIRKPNQRMTAQVSLLHPWIKASSKQNSSGHNLDGSMSSLDSALCMDSASSVEPSPISSASSSFSPAPSSVSRSGASSSVAVHTSSTTAAPGSTNGTSFSQPEDMKEVNKKLSQISMLATENMIADTTSKPRPEGSPTSTASSTSTLKGEEAIIESTVVTSPVLPPTEVKLDGTDGMLADSDKNKAEKLSSKSTTTDYHSAGNCMASKEKEQGKENSSERRTISFETKKSSSYSEPTERRTTSFEHSVKLVSSSFRPKTTEHRTTSFDKTQKVNLSASYNNEPTKLRWQTERQKSVPSSPRLGRKEKEDMVALDPKTIESILRFQQLKEKKKWGSDSGNRSESSTKDESKKKGEEDTARLTERQPAAVSHKQNEKVEAVTLSAVRSPSPKAGNSPPSSKSPSPNSREQAQEKDGKVCKSDATAEKIDADQKQSLSAEEEKAIKKQDQKSEEEIARIEREKAREARRKARMEEEKRKEEERKRLKEAAEQKKTEEKRRMELEREQFREAMRKEREVKQAKDAVAVDANTRASQTSVAKSKAKQLESDEKEKPISEIKISESSKKEKSESHKLVNSSEGKGKTSQNGKDIKAPQPKSPTTASKIRESPVDKTKPVVPTVMVSDTQKSLSPEIKFHPAQQSTTSEPSCQKMTSVSEPNLIRASVVRSRRERSPISAIIKSNRRQTPVISADAVDKILRGEIEEGEEASMLQYAISSSRDSFHQHQLESCIEEEEPLPKGKSLSPHVKDERFNSDQNDTDRQTRKLQSALKSSERILSSDSKRRVTLLTTKDRTQSIDDPMSQVEQSVSPSPSPDPFSKSYDAKYTTAHTQKPEGISRLTVSSNYATLSHSTPDLSEILGSPKRNKEPKKVERTHSRRMGRSKMDSYVTSTNSNSSYYQSPHSRSGRLGTLPSRLLGGKSLFSKSGHSSYKVSF